MKLPIFTLTLLFFISLLAACSHSVTNQQQLKSNQPASDPTTQANHVKEGTIATWQALWPLPERLRESSGLFCDNSLQQSTYQGDATDAPFQMPVLFSHNDSGHAAELFELSWPQSVSDHHQVLPPNAAGVLHHPPTTSPQLKSISTALASTDIEAIAGNSQWLWLADIGNNAGQRSQLQLLPFDRRQQRWLAARTLTYHNFKQDAGRQKYQHDIDAEALVFNGENLVMFSKSWQSRQSHVYIIDPDAPAQTLTVVTQTATLPGVITDAAYDAVTQRYLLLGYRRFQDNLWSLLLHDNYQGFIAVLDQDFQLLQLLHLPASGQVEGICLDPQRRIWISQEQSERRSAQLFLLGHMDMLMP